MDVKVFTEDGALELAEKLLQNDKNIKDEFEQKGYATEVFVTNAIANAQLSGGDVDLSGYASKDDLDNYAIKEHSHDEYLTEHQDLSDYALKSQIPSLDGYAKTEDIPDEYDDTVLSNRITTVENDYLKSSDKTELTQAIATAKTETIEIILGESVDADFDTLQEVADWIQADTTASAELVIRVTDAESDIVTIQNDYLKSVDKTELLSSISTNATAISKNTTDIAKNATTIEENAEAIADNTTAIAVERARIDALIALEPSEDPTDIEREIEDLKIKVDGTTATTAGDAVREQIGALSSEIANVGNLVVDTELFSDYSKVTQSLNNGIYDLSFYGFGLFQNNEPLYMREKFYDSLNGLSVVKIQDTSVIGLVFKRSETFYYFITIMSRNEIAVYKISDATPGYYTELVKITGVTSKVDSITVTDVTDDYITFAIIHDNQETIKTVNYADYGITGENVIGFIPYNNNIQIDIGITLKPQSKIMTEEEVTNIAESVVKSVVPIQEKSCHKKIANILTNGGQIKLLGDSITAGVGGTGFNDKENGGGVLLSEEDSIYENLNGHCWANSFKDYVMSKYSNVVVKNYGISGIGSTRLVGKLPTLIEDDDDLIICMIGTNDRWKDDPINMLFNNLNSIYNYAKANGKEIIFMANLPCSVERETVEGGVTYIMHMEDVDQTVFRFAMSKDMDYISVYKMVLDYCKYTNTTVDSYLADKLHPNNSGYDMMFYLISNALGIATKRDGATW